MRLLDHAIQKAGLKLDNARRFNAVKQYIKLGARYAPPFLNSLTADEIEKIRDARLAFNHMRNRLALMGDDKLKQRSPAQFQTLTSLRTLFGIQAHKGKCVGVEIEFFHSESIRNLHPLVSLGQDGSIRTPDDERDDDGEIVTRWRASEARLVYVKGVSENRLEKLCQTIRNAGGLVNNSCGLHVHLDQRDVTRQGAYARAIRLTHSLSFLKLMVPKSRTRENTYCKLNNAGELNCNDRYYAINWCSWCEHKTIEVRLHSGTTSADKIKNWVEILDACQRHTIPTFSDFMASPYVSMKAKIWAINRIRKFNPDSLEGFEGTDHEGSER
ncbi:MAG: hypothetical protein EBV19_08070 [Flavobacteriia bacterium]|nr:hypothetical protein [Flavobacteriia bacterium]